MTLEGMSALVVEDQYLIAIDLERILHESGATRVLNATLAECRSCEWLTREAIALALVEIRTIDDGLRQAVANLRRNGIAVVFSTTTFEHVDGYPDFPAVPVIVKPFDEAKVRAAIAKALLASGHDGHRLGLRGNAWAASSQPANARMTEGADVASGP